MSEPTRPNVDIEESNYNDVDEIIGTDYKCPNCDLDGIVALCKEKEEKLNLAGQYGLKLQEELQECHIHMDEMRVQHDAQVEGKIQEIYELKIKLETMEKSMEDQNLIMKHTVNDLNLAKQKLLSDANEKENALKAEKTSTLAQLNKVQLRERQLNDKIVQLEEKNVQLMNEKQKKRVEVDFSYNQELFTLNEKVIEMEEDIIKLDAENEKLRNENEMACFSVKTLQAELLDKRNELEASESKSTGYFNHLEKSREENLELKTELEALKLQLKQSGHLRKGNSLFGEVEDERMSMEKKLKTMEVKFDSIQKAYLFLKNQHHNLKCQVTALLSMHSGKADIDYIRNIERALSQAKSENANLLIKLDALQSNKKDDELEEGINLKELAKNLPNFESSEDVIDFLTIKFEEAKTQIEKLRKELNQIHMIKMAESDKLLTAEQKLHETGTIAEKYKSANMNLRLKLEEVENKYKAENQKRILIEKKFSYDSSNDVEPIGITVQKPHSPPPFAKQQNKVKSQKHGGRRGDEKQRKTDQFVFSDAKWDNAIKAARAAQKSRASQRDIDTDENPSVFDATVEKANVPQEATNIDAMEETGRRKVSFKENFSPSPEKENNSNVLVAGTQSTESKNPSSCLKKSNASKRVTTCSNKESNLGKSKGQNFNNKSNKIQDDQPCDVQ